KGMGCFWGAERKFWTQKGVYSTQVGYAGGYTPNPSYEEVCSGKTGHTEIVRVVYNPGKVCFEKLLKVFWESHNPTQGMRQGNDTGTQYRSAIYTYTQEQMDTVNRSKEEYQKYEHIYTPSPLANLTCEGSVRYGRTYISTQENSPAMLSCSVAQVRQQADCIRASNSSCQHVITPLGSRSSQ
ncbi:UNVERIFIED_CONTAM: hypothetical protein FKN15_006902, partial [Acipenser sinensis]